MHCVTVQCHGGRVFFLLSRTDNTSITPQICGTEYFII